MVVAIVAAVAAGACFAMAGVLQQRVAQTRPETESLSIRLLTELAHQRIWVAGIGLAFLSYGFQALALAFGPLILVQPLIATEVIFALPASALLHGTLLGLREWAGTAMVAGGLALAIAVARPQGGDDAAPLVGWLWTLLTVVAVVAIAVMIGRRHRGPVRASAFALAGGVVMGTQSALFAATVTTFRTEGVAPAFGRWQTYVLVVASLVGLMLIQSAFQAGPLATSMPVVDLVEPLTGVLLGLLLFHETIASGAAERAVAASAMVVVLAGIVILDTSPMIERLHRQERTHTGEDEGQVRLRARR